VENNIFKKEDLVCLLAEKTGFYKKNMREVVDALEDVILECFQSATFEHDSELHLAPGVVLVGKRKPAGEVTDPRTGETVMGAEKVIPSAVFKQSIRQKLYVRKKKGRK
jgi:nucleoid DNA-binding protein